MNIFGRRKYVSINKEPENQNTENDAANEPIIPDGLWIKCSCCQKTIYSKDLGSLKICPQCGGCLRLGARERLEVTVDEGSFIEMDKDMRPRNPLDYPGYEDKTAKLAETTGVTEAVVTGECKIKGFPCVIGVMDSNFIMGSMGSVVGEKLARVFESGIEKRLPVVIFTASGGARMQEGIISLMQMAKVSAAAKRHSDQGLLYVTVLTDPTTGGVTASFAMLGDIIISEPGALIGFAGRRVIEQTIKQSLPDDFQKAEFLLEHGFVDCIVRREDMRDSLGNVLMLHCEDAELVAERTSSAGEETDEEINDEDETNDEDIDSEDIDQETGEEA